MNIFVAKAYEYVGHGIAMKMGAVKIEAKNFMSYPCISRMYTKLICTKLEILLD